MTLSARRAPALLLAALTAALTPALAGCAGAPPDTSLPTTQTAPPCAELPPPDRDATLPESFPSLPDQVLYAPASQGATRILFGRVPGTDFRALRDRLARDLVSAGYTLDGTDQEAVEAEVHFSQPTEGSVRVRVLCAGVLELRYRLSG